MYFQVVDSINTFNKSTLNTNTPNASTSYISSSGTSFYKKNTLNINNPSISTPDINISNISIWKISTLSTSILLPASQILVLLEEVLQLYIPLVHISLI